MPDFYILLAYILAYIGMLATSFYIVNIVSYYKKNPKPGPATDKTVSILLPAFNEERSIKRTVESALSLDYPREKLEIIIIDNASKDGTFAMAKKFESSSNPVVKVLREFKKGKGNALNTGIKEARGEIIVTMDADTFVHADALKKMVGFFSQKDVMCVAPSIGIYKPRSLLQRVQQIEYYMGVFLRKSFASMNAVHITPGAFSAYRKVFFGKHGGFEAGNLTEDLELALRIQSCDYVIENATEAVVYTIAPRKFKDLLYQRRRWYVGLMRNLWNYRRLFGVRKGALGAVVLPVAVSTVVLSVVLTSYLVVRAILKVREELLSLNAINFNFDGVLDLNTYTLERVFFMLFSSKIFLLSVLFIALLWFYMMFSRKEMRYSESIKMSFFFFTIFYSLLFAFWWIISFAYGIFNKDVAWRVMKNA